MAIAYNGAVSNRSMESRFTMDHATQTLWEQVHSTDGDVRLAAFDTLMLITEQPVDWAYEIWDTLVAELEHPNGHQRAIAAQLLCNLAKSDPEHRILNDFETMFKLLRDDKFVIARHTLQSMWKIGLVSVDHRKLVIDRLSGWFYACGTMKNATLMRYDILQGLRKLYNEVGDPLLRDTARALIATEPDLKYRKKYATLWR